MNSGVLSAAPFQVQIHIALAGAVLLVGAVQMFGPKGTGLHRLLGYGFAVLTLILAASSLTLHEWTLFEGISPIHILSVLVIWALPLAIYQARRKRAEFHGRLMRIIYFGMIGGALLLTFLPGRLMNMALFGG